MRVLDEEQRSAQRTRDVHAAEHRRARGRHVEPVVEGVDGPPVDREAAHLVGRPRVVPVRVAVREEVAVVDVHLVAGLDAVEELGLGLAHRRSDEEPVGRRDAVELATGCRTRGDRDARAVDAVERFADEHDADLLVRRRGEEHAPEPADRVLGRFVRVDRARDGGLDVEHGVADRAVGTGVTDLRPERVEVLGLAFDEEVGLPRPQEHTGVESLGHAALGATREARPVQVRERLALRGREPAERVTGAARLHGVDDASRSASPRRRRALFIAAYLCSVFWLPTTLATPASQTRSSVFSMHTIVR